jgi:hypothetical protein
MNAFPGFRAGRNNRHLVRSQSLLNQAAAICDLPALCTQANNSISILEVLSGFAVRHNDFRSSFFQSGY